MIDPIITKLNRPFQKGTLFADASTPDATTTEQNVSSFFTLDFALCFISFLSLQLINIYSSMATIVFILPWVLIGTMKRQILFRACFINWPLFLPVIVALSSVFWSDDPQWTMKASIELLVTLLIGLIAATCVNRKIFMGSILCSLFVTALLCTPYIWNGSMQLPANKGALLGFFGSKNAFADAMALLILSAVAFYFEMRSTSPPWPLIICSLILALPMLLMGHSTGATISVILTLAIFYAASQFKRFSPLLRLLTIFALLTFVIGVITLPLLFGSDGASVLSLLGKDASLTGRTSLWDSAVQNIMERPILGTGYGAFWQLGNTQAQALWYDSHVTAGAGFNFHNEYLEIFVELGAIGFVTFSSLIIALIYKIALLLRRPPFLGQSFAFIMAIYFLIRTPTEVRILSQFAPGLILFCVVWIYSTAANSASFKRSATRISS